MKIRTKLILMYLLGAILTSATSFFAIRSYSAIEENYSEVINDPVKKIESLRRIEQDGLQINSTTSKIILLTAFKKIQERSEGLEDFVENEERQLMLKRRKNLERSFDSYRNLVFETGESEKENLNEILVAGNNLLARSDEIIKLKNKGVSSSEILNAKKTFEKEEQNFLIVIENSIRLQNQKLTERQSQLLETIQKSSQKAVLITVIAFFLAVLGGLFLSRSISLPLAKLQAATRKIGEGDLETKIKTDSTDEIGELAVDFAKMTLKLNISQNEIVKNSNLVENIFDSMADLLITVDDEGIIQKVNQTTLLLLGYEENEMVGQPVSLLTGRETFLSEAEFDQMISDKKLVEVEKDFVNKKGEKLTVLISSSILHGHSAAAVIVAKDISRRLEDERKLQEYAGELEQTNQELEVITNSYKEIAENLKLSQNELITTNNFTNNVMDSMVDFVVVVDMDLLITRVNPATLKLNGYEEHELLGQSINILMGDRPFNEKGVNILREKGTIENLDKLNRCKDGRLIPISLSMSVLKDENNEDCGIVCVGKNVTQIVKAREDLEKTNERLRQSNRELEDFAYVASHDLQEPLRKVQAFGDRLQRKCADVLTEEGNDYIRRMREAASRMQNLINDLLTFSRVTSKAQPFQTLNLKKIAEEVISDLEVRIEQTNGKVEIGELPFLDADPVQMRQLLQNLIGNALKFHRADENPFIKIYSDAPTMTGGSFSIAGKEVQTVGNSNQVCKIIVQDNGIGFDEKYLHKIFTVFQRLHGRSEYEGSGIGLAVCRKIAERHGGSITAESIPNQGSTFLVTLPLTQTDKEID